MAGVLDGITARRSTVLDGVSAGTAASPEEQEYLSQIAAARQGEFSRGLRRAGKHVPNRGRFRRRFG